VQVIYLSPEDNPGAVKYFGASPEDTPIVVVHDPAKDAKYVSGKKIEAKKVKQWIEDFKAGKIERHIKSEDPPKKNDGPVKIVTAKTFKDIVYSGKNVLVEFYAPVRSPDCGNVVLRVFFLWLPPPVDERLPITVRCNLQSLRLPPCVVLTEASIRHAALLAFGLAYTVKCDAVVRTLQEVGAGLQ
jgi:hypothetical protein